MRILIAEDERKTRAILEQIALDLGCETIVASSGLDAVRLAQEKRPDVLLLDGLLPELHGFEVSRAVRALAEDYHPRIIIITAIYKDPRYQREAKVKFDVDGYLVKPVTAEALKAAIFGDKDD
jgi:DNA-binding response OmpR family regulator